MLTSTCARRIAAGCALFAVTVALGACGSSSTQSTKSSVPSPATTPAGQKAPASGASPAVRQAEAAYAKFVKAQPPVTVPALPKKPSPQTITITTCPLPSCTSATVAAQTAAQDLGWKVTYLTAQVTPSSVITTLNDVVQHPTQLVAITPLVPNALISKQLAALTASGAKVVEMAPAGGGPGGPVQATTVGAPFWDASATLMADAVIHDAGGSATTALVTDPSVPAWVAPRVAFTKSIEASGGSVADVQVGLSEVGKQIPSQIVTYVQSHPDVKYLAFVDADLDAGVPQALQAAGLTKQVKIVSAGPEPGDLAALKQGTELAQVAQENAGTGWRAIDQLARLSEGVPLGDEQDPAGWHQILTGSNVTNTSAVPVPPGVPGAFLKAWHVK